MTRFERCHDGQKIREFHLAVLIEARWTRAQTRPDDEQIIKVNLRAAIDVLDADTDQELIRPCIDMIIKAARQTIPFR